MIGFLERLVGQVDDGLTQTISNLDLPAVGLLASSGVIGLIFIVRWMIKFQREFTNFYIDENNKLRLRIDACEVEIKDKEDQITASTREMLKYEREADVRMRALERTIAEHELTITELQRRLKE